MHGVERIAIDVRSGRIQWREIEGDPDLHFSPSVHIFYELVDATVYAGRDGLSVYDATTGALKWRLALGRISEEAGVRRTARLHGNGGWRSCTWSTSRRAASSPRTSFERKLSDVVLAGPRVYVKSFTDDQDAHELYGFDLIDD